MRNLSSFSFFLFFLILNFSPFSIHSQEQIDFSKLGNEQTKIAAKPSQIMSIKPAAKLESIADLPQNGWDVSLAYLGFKHGSDVPKDQLDSLKRRKTLKKVLDSNAQLNPETENSNALVVDPVVQIDFKGNAHNGLTPPDNHIAISDEGNIVSVVNSSVAFADEGGVISQSSFSDFFSVLGLTGIYFDPRVQYDPVEDKFVMVVLNGNTPSNTNIVIAFSTTSDPADSWWFYVFDGDPGNTNAWFDFPSMGLSNSELYISGNLFDQNDVFTSALIYQIEKSNGFTGGTIDFITWQNVTDDFGVLDFTVTPISYGFDGSLTPGIFFVSSDAGGGDDVMLYWTTNTIDENPSLVVNAIPVDAYSVAGDGQQLGTAQLISTNDCRTLSGFYSDDIVHYVHNTSSNGFSRIYYGRIEVSTLTATNAPPLGLNGFEYAFPSVAPFATSTTDPTVLIGFLRTGATIYPEFRVATCDQNFEWSPSQIVREGDDFVDFLTSNTERWGDYSGITKRHDTGVVELWVSGCYGENADNGFSDVLGTWIAKIGTSSVQLPPNADFVADQTTIVEGDQVTFADLSQNNPTSWSWSFQGGDPGTSTQQNPVVQYDVAGVYNVSLTATNAAGSNMETKNSYITVNEVVIAPVADFSANETDILEGDIVQFSDLSVNDPTSWNWSFPGGTPSSSTVQNPSIIYNTPGVYNVSLQVSNQAGNDTEVKTGYIMVDEIIAVEDVQGLFNSFQVYPNPTQVGKQVFVDFELKQKMELDFYLVDASGKPVKHLLFHRTKQGDNRLSFNTALLSSGTYFLIIKDNTQKALRNAKIIITD